MATHYVQVKSKWQGDRWRTVYDTDDKEKADFFALSLRIDAHQYGPDKPGLTGARNARVISKTALKQEMGAPGVRMAIDDLNSAELMDRDTPQSMSRNPRRKIEPLRFMTWAALRLEVEEIEESWDADHAKIDTTNFLLRGMPADLHRRMKDLAFTRDTTITALVYEACEKFLVDRGEKQ